MVVELSSLDYIVIGIYFILLLCIGFFLSSFVKDLSSYLKGSSTIPWVISGVANFMARCSTFIFVAYAGIAHEEGLISIVVLWSTVPACIFASLFLAKRWRRAKVISPVEYLETRFNTPVHQLSTWSGLFIRLLDNMVRLYAIGIFLCAVTPLSMNEALIITGVLIVLFTMFGGLWSVTVMSTVQFIALILITIILLPLSLKEVGGINGIAEAVPGHIDIFNGAKGAPLWLIAYYVMITIKYNSSWAFIQRLYCVKDEKSAVKVGYLTGGLFLVFSIVFLLPAVASKVMFPDIPDKEMSYIMVSAKLLPSGLMGFMVASLLSTTVSTLNAEYNAISSVLTKDIFVKFFKISLSEKEKLHYAHLATIIVGGIVLTGSLFIGHIGGVFEANKLFTGMFAIPVGVPLVLGLLIKRTSSNGAFATIILGVLVGVILNLFPDNYIPWEIATLVEICFCIVVFILWPSSRNPDYRLKVESFFKRITTSIPKNEIPQIDLSLKKSLINIFPFSFLACGIFFIVISFSSLHSDSGLYALVAGCCSLVLSIIVRFGIK